MSVRLPIRPPQSTLARVNLLPLIPVLASADFHSPLLWAVVAGWTMSVVLHEFAHGIVAHFGGDYTIADRGLLTLNPLKFVDPLFSIAMPLFFMLKGGLPLAGGVTYVRDDLLRSRGWATAVSLAGPAMNFLLFLLLILPFQSRWGWIHPAATLDQWTPLQIFLAVLGMLQFVVCIINLIPIPPLDGFNAIKPWFDAGTRELLSTPPARFIGIFVLFFVIFQIRPVIDTIYALEHGMVEKLGVEDGAQELMRQAFNKVLFGM
jgi:Zn-dependent protease